MMTDDDRLARASRQLHWLETLIRAERADPLPDDVRRTFADEVKAFMYELTDAELESCLDDAALVGFDPRLTSLRFSHAIRGVRCDGCMRTFDPDRHNEGWTMGDAWRGMDEVRERLGLETEP